MQIFAVIARSTAEILGGGAIMAPPRNLSLQNSPGKLGLTGPKSMIGQMGHRRNLCTHYTLDHTFGQKVYLVNQVSFVFSSVF